MQYCLMKKLRKHQTHVGGYLEALAKGGFLQKRKVGRSNYYINVPLYNILAGERMQGGSH